MKKTFLSAMLLSGVLASTAWGAFPLVKNGKGAAIIVPQNGESSSHLAAEELAKYVEKVSGVKCSIVKNKPLSAVAGPKVVIGTLAVLEKDKNFPRSIGRKLKATKRDDATIYFTQGNTFYIAGHKKAGELYGTYRLIEEELGVRFLKPADDVDSGEYIPKKKTLLLKDKEYLFVPYFKYRRIDNTGSFGTVIPYRGASWAVRAGMQAPPPYCARPESRKDFAKFYGPRTQDMLLHTGGHLTFDTPIPAKKYFKTNPEYFSLYNGKRSLIKMGGHQYCISNPKVQQLVADHILKRFRKYGPQKDGFLFGMLDTGIGWCECNECRKLDDSKTYNHLDISTRFHKVADIISKKVYAEMPDANIHIWAYHTYRNIPKGVKHDLRSTVQYCIHGRCYGHRLDDPSCQRNVREYNRLLAWKKMGNPLYTYEYFTCTPCLYVPGERRQAYELKLYKKLGLEGYKEEGSFSDSRFVGNKSTWEAKRDKFPSCWQYLYVTAKMLQDPDQDVDKLLEDAESKYYTKAYPAMKPYHALRRKLWENNKNCMGYPTGDQRNPSLLAYPGAEKTLLGYLAQAKKLAGNDKILLHRLALDEKFLQKYWIAPHRKLQENAGKALFAPRKNGPIKIDGKGDEPAWAGAQYVTNFKATFGDRKGTPIPDEIATSVGILSDEKNLYLLFTAKEPKTNLLRSKGGKDGELWSDDCVEIFLYPPTAANTYYHIIVNPKGAVYDALCPGNTSGYDVGMEVKTSIGKDRYIVEARIPASNLASFTKGDVWKVLFTRTRKLNIVEEIAYTYSLDAIRHHDYPSFLALQIGSPYVKNGTFDQVKNGRAPHWSFTKGKGAIVKEGPNNLLKLEKGGSAYQTLAYKGIGQTPSPRKITISFRAKGPGGVNVLAYRYTDTRDEKAKHGYRRKWNGSKRIKSLKLDKTMRLYTMDYTIEPNMWISLAFHSVKEPVFIDDVSVKLNK